MQREGKIRLSEPLDVSSVERLNTLLDQSKILILLDEWNRNIYDNQKLENERDWGLFNMNSSILSIRSISTLFGYQSYLRAIDI